MSELWVNNKDCPQCGEMLLDGFKIEACETGLSYCSIECATKHVNKTYKEDGH